jgi:hypothetical protein
LVIFDIFIVFFILFSDSTWLSCCFAPFVIFCVQEHEVVKLKAQSFIDFFFKWIRVMPSHFDPCLMCCFPNFAQWFLVIFLVCSPSLFFVCRNLEWQSSNFRSLLFTDILFKWARFTPPTFTP